MLRHSNLLVFIDPYLDPAKPQYHHLGRLLTRSGDRSPAPRIEIHRALIEDKGPRIERGFRDTLADPLRAAGLSADVFIWSKFHDRFLLSNLAAISFPYGFGYGDQRPRGHPMDAPGTDGR